VYIGWDIEEYYLEHLKGGRDKKRVLFPNPSFGKFSDPLSVVDKKGRIVLWYLPGLLSEEQQVRIFFSAEVEGLTHSKQSIVKQATITIEPILKKSVMEERLNKPKPNWRTHDVNFLDDSSRDTLEPGAVNFSAGWLGQGHTVSFIFYIITKSNLKRIK